LRQLKIYITLFFAAITLAATSSFHFPGKTEDEQEYILKAAFLYRFTDYVEWADNNTGEYFTIAVLGKSGITSPLVDIAKDKKIKGKKIIIKEYQNINDVDSCQMLFISNKYNGDVGTITSKVGDRPMLIVAEQNDACEKGAHINFLISENKLKFEVNLNAVARAGLKISSQLLQHAIIVNAP
jgi:hypothetical protein